MTATQIIEQIRHLSPEEQSEVIRFAYRLDAKRRLTGAELSALARRLADATDPAEAALVRETIARGFYGGKPDAWGSSPKHPARAAPSPSRRSTNSARSHPVTATAVR